MEWVVVSPVVSGKFDGISRGHPEFVQSDMAKISDPLTEFERLAVFRVIRGAPFSDIRPADTVRLADARAASVGPPGTDWRRSGVPFGVIHSEVFANPDDGIHRNCYAIGHLHFLPPLENKAMRTRLLQACGRLCSYCDKPFKFITADHVWPAQHGGISRIENRVAVCAPCNFCAGSERTGTIWVRRAFVRMRRSDIEPDKRSNVPELLKRFAHLHADLL